MIRRLTDKLSGLRELFFFDNWPHLLATRLFWPGQPLVVYRLGALEFLVDHAGGDQNGTRACLTSGMYDQALQGMSKNKPLRVLDIGANGGGFVLNLLAKGFSLETAMCVEMNPHTFSRLHFNVKRNVAGRGLALNAAAWSENSVLKVSVGHGSTGDSVSSAGGQGTEVEIQARTLNSLIEEGFGSHEIDLCKIDIEGAEFELLLGSDADRLTQVKRLVMEIHPHPRHQAKELLEHLQAAGFKAVGELQQEDGGCVIYCGERATDSKA